MTQTSQEQNARKRYKPVSMNGEMVTFIVPEDGQLVALMRCYEVIKSDISILDQIPSITLAEDILLSLLSMPDEWVTKLQRGLAMGTTNLGALTNAFFEAAQGGEDGGETPLKKAVKRGRPRKNAAASAE